MQSAILAHPPMSLSVLIADDDPDHRLILRYLLTFVSDSMTIVGEAADGADASISRSVSGPTS